MKPADFCLILCLIASSLSIGCGHSNEQTPVTRSSFYSKEESLKLDCARRQMLRNPNYYQPNFPIGQSATYETIQDIWEAAEDLESNASHILSQARDENCPNAEASANDAISLAEDCKSMDNFNDAQSYLEEAQGSYNNAEGYLSDCNNQDNEE